MIKESEYVTHASELLVSFGVTFEVRHVGNACPRSCKDRDDMREAGKFPRKKHIHGDQHLIIFSRPGGTDKGGTAYPACSFTLNFWNSYSDGFALWAKHNYYRPIGRGPIPAKSFSVKPSAYDVLACIQKSDVGTFKDFCSDFGYSDDSISALDTYLATQEEFEKVRRFFTSEELKQLQEVV